MTSHTAWLHGLALVHAGEGNHGPAAVEALVEAADGSESALLGALTWSRALQRHLPRDERVRLGADLLARAVQVAAQRPTPSSEPSRLAGVRTTTIDLRIYDDVDRLRSTVTA